MLLVLNQCDSFKSAFKEFEPSFVYSSELEKMESQYQDFKSSFHRLRLQDLDSVCQTGLVLTKDIAATWFTRAMNETGLNDTLGFLSCLLRRLQREGDVQRAGADGDVSDVDGGSKGGSEHSTGTAHGVGDADRGLEGADGEGVRATPCTQRLACHALHATPCMPRIARHALHATPCTPHPVHHTLCATPCTPHLASRTLPATTIACVCPVRRWRSSMAWRLERLSAQAV